MLHSYRFPHCAMVILNSYISDNAFYFNPSLTTAVFELISQCNVHLPFQSHSQRYHLVSYASVILCPRQKVTRCKLASKTPKVRLDKLRLLLLAFTADQRGACSKHAVRRRLSGDAKGLQIQF